jgi:hypothetical protein
VVFVEGGRKGVIRLPEGRGGWGWRRFIEELHPLSTHLVAKVLPAVGNAWVSGSPPSYAEVLAAPLGGLKPGLQGCNTPIKVTFYLEDSLLTERLSLNL